MKATALRPLFLTSEGAGGGRWGVCGRLREEAEEFAVAPVYAKWD